MKIKIISTLISVLLLTLTYGQVSDDTNAPVVGNYVGFDNTSIVPLPIRNIGDPRINISSNGSNKFAITELPTWNGLNGLSQTQVQRTTMGLQNETNLGWSMLHLLSNAGGVLPIGLRRSWMNVGTSYTANQDFMYSGLLERPIASLGSEYDKNTDAVIAWGCQDEGPSADNFRFLFIKESTGNPDDQGLETMRITPWGNVGIGEDFNNSFQPRRRLEVSDRSDSAQFRISWYRNAPEGLGTHSEFQVTNFGNLHIKPRNNGSARATAIGFLQGEASNPYHSGAVSTRLDVGGLTRIRLLPDSTPRSLITGYQLAGANNGVGDNFLGRIDFLGDTCLVLNSEGKWTNVCNLSGGDLDWNTDGLDVWTGLSTGSYPPGKVGIGIHGNSAQAKLEVRSFSRNTTAGSIGIKTVTNAVDPLCFVNFGHWAEVSGAIDSNYGYYTRIIDGNSLRNIGSYYQVTGNGVIENTGVRVTVSGASSGSTSRNIGFDASVVSISTPALDNFGVTAKACGSTNNYAIYGTTCTSTSGGANWAGYFNGDVYSSGLYIGSDANIKEDIQEIPNASEILSSLNPKSYFFQDQESLVLSSTKQYGLIAQELEELLPELIKDAVLPAELDSAGNIITESVTIKSVRYNDLIAILIAGFQEQNATVTDQAAHIAAQNVTISALEAELEVQATQLEEIQSNMQFVLASVQTMQAKTANCCNTKTGNGNTGALENNGKNKLELDQNIPNPFDDQTRIAFYLPKTAQIILEITDAAGRPIERLIDGQLSSGEHSTIWDGSNVASGIYFYTLYADGELITKKMIKK